MDMKNVYSLTSKLTNYRALTLFLNMIVTYILCINQLTCYYLIPFTLNNSKYTLLL